MFSWLKFRRKRISILFWISLLSFLASVSLFLLNINDHVSGQGVSREGDFERIITRVLIMILLSLIGMIVSVLFRKI
jgi:hypothetical protein